MEKELLSVQLQVERGGGGVIHDGQQPVQYPPLHHSFKGVELDADDRPSFPDQFFYSACVTGSDAAPPAKKSALEDLQHLAAHVEGSQFPQKIESAHPLLVHSVSVDPPVQPIVERAVSTAALKKSWRWAYLRLGDFFAINQSHESPARDI